MEDPDIPADAGISIEFQIPLTSKRIDFIITGLNEVQQEQVVIIELKQWSSAELTDKDALVKTRFQHGISETAHPSYQAWSYATLIKDYNQTVRDEQITLTPCAYLHNYPKDQIITNPRYEPYITEAPPFFQSDAGKLREFIKKYVKYGDSKDILYKIENGRLRPSKQLADNLVSMLKGNQEFIMLDDQKVVYETALSMIRKASADKKQVLIVKGGPGTGKTTLAKVIANTTSAEFLQINATSAGKKDMEDVIAQAKNNQGMYGKKTILFIDEIHRFNKGQQDYLLPFVEDGTIILIGATTENPYFEVNAALISRSIIFELKSLEISEVKELILRAVNDKTKGMGNYKARIDEDALDFLADMAGGDARNALNAIELGILTTPRSEDGLIHITLDVASQCIQKRVVRYDKNGDNHYDIISAFIKSMRGSDPDAAVYYLAKMLYAGEDVKFIARRIMILASEDIGNADPQALCVAVAAAQAVERVGMPESQIILSQAVTYMACAPKSNSAVNAIFAAMDSVKRTKTTVPPEIQGEHFYELSEMGYEKTLKEYQNKIKSQS